MPNHRSRGSYRRDRNAAQKTVIDWTPRFVVAMVAFFCMAAYELTLNLMQSADLIILKGWPAVTDGDTLVVKDVPVRLKWIDAPELDQICLNGKGVAYSCGTAAKAALVKHIGWSRVTCTGTKKDKYGRLLAHCTRPNVNNVPVDIGLHMLRKGHASVLNGSWTRGSRFAQRAAELGSRQEARLSEKYERAMEEARTRKLGQWAGSFDAPLDWRRNSTACKFCHLPRMPEDPRKWWYS